MKIETTARNLREALACINPVIERRNTIPVLGAVKIADGKLTATDLDMEASVTLPSKGAGKGAGCADMKRLTKVLQYVDDDDEIDLNFTRHDAIATFNGSEYRMVHFPPGDFPKVNVAEEGVEVKTGNLGIVAAMRTVRFAVSDEETRYYLNGVCLSKDQHGHPVAVATNGHQLAAKPLSTEIDGAHGAIVPRKLVDFLVRQKGGPESCRFMAERSAGRFAYSGLTVTGKFIDGAFPDWHRVLVRDPVDVVTFDRAKLNRAIDRICAWTRSERCVQFDISGGSASLLANEYDAPCCEKVDCVSHQERRPAFGLKLLYLRRAMSALADCDQVTFRSERNAIGNAPIQMTGDMSDLLILTMPMRA